MLGQSNNYWGKRGTEKLLECIIYQYWQFIGEGRLLYIRYSWVFPTSKIRREVVHEQTRIRSRWRSCMDGLTLTLTLDLELDGVVVSVRPLRDWRRIDRPSRCRRIDRPYFLGSAWPLHASRGLVKLLLLLLRSSSSLNLLVVNLQGYGTNTTSKQVDFLIFFFLLPGRPTHQINS
jgi:hypothetical protein